MQQQEPNENQPADQNRNSTDEADRVRIQYFTDPLCCWSWGFEKSLYRLEQELGSQLSITYTMGGLLRDWKNFHDPYNSISRPLQMAPLWMHAAELTQSVINPQIWHSDPPASSYPACLAVKTAALQSAAAEKNYLLRTREAVMTRGLNISRMNVLFQIAEEVAVEIPEKFSANQFMSDWNKRAGLDSFDQDVKATLQNHVTRFPTLLMTHGQERKWMTGYRSYDQLLQELDEMKLSGINGKQVRSTKHQTD